MEATRARLSGANLAARLAADRASSVDAEMRNRFARPYLTTEVPPFATLHEQERRRLEQRKHQNRYVTQPEPFVFHAPKRAKSPKPLPKDPTVDWRWKRAQSASAASTRLQRVASERLGGEHLAVRAQQPSAVAPPRTTEKTLSWQSRVRAMMMERRTRESKDQQELEQAREVDVEMRRRVQQAVGLVEPLEDKISRIVDDKQQCTRQVCRDKRRDLRMIKERASRRPLLMEQADTLVRARRRALFRVRSALEAAGVRDVESHFHDDELDELQQDA